MVNTLYDALRNAYTEHRKHPKLRLGQCVFNNVYEIPSLQNFIDMKIRGTNKDCFYNDAYINDFIKAVKNEVLLRIFTDADVF